MALRETFEQSGNWCFRWRSYLPLLALPVLACEIGRGPWRPAEGWAEASRDAACFALSLLGLAVRVFTIGHVPERTSGRNTKGQIADSLNTTGAYSVVRHPLYAGNFLMWLGVVLSCCHELLLVLFVLAFALYYERIMFAEEEFLRRKFGRQFIEWAAVTPAFFPRLSQWRPPSLPFSVRKALRHEYSGFFALVAGFCAVRVLEDSVTQGKLIVAARWLALFLAGSVIYLVMRTLKKHTRLLHAERR